MSAKKVPCRRPGSGVQFHIEGSLAHGSCCDPSSNIVTNALGKWAIPPPVSMDSNRTLVLNDFMKRPGSDPEEQRDYTYSYEIDHDARLLTTFQYEDGKLIRIVKTNIHGKLHCLDGPAEIQYDDDGNIAGEFWFVNGTSHREGGLPAVTLYHNGDVRSQEWRIDGGRYRDGDLPSAVTYGEDGRIHSESWVDETGRRGRSGGKPSYIINEKDGTRTVIWHIRGRKHRIDGPSLIRYDADGSVLEQSFSYNGTLINERQIEVAEKIAEELDVPYADVAPYTMTDLYPKDLVMRFIENGITPNQAFAVCQGKSLPQETWGEYLSARDAGVPHEWATEMVNRGGRR